MVPRCSVGLDTCLRAFRCSTTVTTRHDDQPIDWMHGLGMGNKILSSWRGLWNAIWLLVLARICTLLRCTLLALPLPAPPCPSSTLPSSLSTRVWRRQWSSSFAGTLAQRCLSDSLSHFAQVSEDYSNSVQDKVKNHHNVNTAVHVSAKKDTQGNMKLNIIDVYIKLGLKLWQTQLNNISWMVFKSIFCTFSQNSMK